MRNRLTEIALSAGTSLALVFTLNSCASKAQQAQVNTPQVSNNPLAGATQLPCADYDTDEYFVGFGTANGSYKRLDVAHPAALANAQQNVRLKMQHAYKGMITNYMDYIGNNQGTDAATHLEAGGNQIIDKVVNDTRVHCGPMVTPPDADGHITVFTGIRIYKQQLASDIASNIANKVSEEDKLKIKFNQQEYEKKMKEAFENYKESQANK